MREVRLGLPEEKYMESTFQEGEETYTQTEKWILAVSEVMCPQAKDLKREPTHSLLVSPEAVQSGPRLHFSSVTVTYGPPKYDIMCVYPARTPQLSYAYG